MIIRLKLLLLHTAFILPVIFSCDDLNKSNNIVSAGSNKDETDGKVLIAMGDHEYPPFEYSDENGSPAGFNIDILNSIASVMNLDVDIRLGPWSDVRERLENGEIDILAGMFKTPEREKKVDFTIPHFISSYAIFVRDDSDIKKYEDIKGREIIVQEGDLGHDLIRESGTAGRIIAKKNWSDTLVSLSKGEGDCAVVALLQGLILLDKHGINNIKPLNQPILQRSYCLAVKDGNSALLAKLNEGLNIIKTSGEYDRIYEKWFGVYEAKSFYQHPYFIRIVILVIFLIAVISGVYFWNLMLHKRIKQKTDALRVELENSNRITYQLQESLAEIARSREEALQSKSDAEKSSEAKSFFLAGVSHELRTPLNGIIGMTNLLYGTELSVEQKSILDMLKSSADNLFRLMADLLEFSRVASGKFRFEISPVLLKDFIINTSSVIGMMAEEKGLVFRVNYPVSDLILLIDKDRLGQVIFNLAGNAVKYTEKGSVVIDITYNGILQISVSDTGMGMSKDVIDEIFNPFMQVKTEGAGKNRGLGLGLAIVKLIVETFGGTIEVESAPGAGSRFTVNIPCREAQAQSVEGTGKKNHNQNLILPVSETGNISVLITEDDQINRVYLERILQKNGWPFDVAGSGDEALEKAKQKHYDVILMDLNLPGMDGLTASAQIRLFEKTHNLKSSAIIAVTAHAYPEDMAKCIDSGMNGYLSKPFSSKKLLDEIKRVLAV